MELRKKQLCSETDSVFFLSEYFPIMAGCEGGSSSNHNIFQSRPISLHFTSFNFSQQIQTEPKDCLDANVEPEETLPKVQWAPGLSVFGTIRHTQCNERTWVR